MEESAENLLSKTSGSLLDSGRSQLESANKTKERKLDEEMKIEPKDASKLIGRLSEVDPVEHRISYRVYRQRWIILAAVALLNNSNTMSWIAFASISNHVDAFYEMNKAANWFSLIYIICTVPMGLFAMWVGSSFELRMTILIAAWANAVGGAIRLISSFLPVTMRFSVGIFGQAMAACAYPFIMFLPTKVAGSWFAEDQRALATTIGIMANPLGVLMANVLSPQIVESSDDVPIMNILTFVPSVVACLIGMFGVTRSTPRTPPSRSAAELQVPFFSGVKQCFTNTAYILLVIVLGGGIAMFNCLYTVIQQLLCATGYSNSFSGLCAALMISGGVFGASISGAFVDRTKLYEETMKVCMSLAVVLGVIFLQLALHAGLFIYLATTAFLFGAAGLASYPVGLEMASECTFPVSETTSTGLVVLSGQIQSIIYVVIMESFMRPLKSAFRNIQVCTVGDASNTTSMPQDSSISVMVMSAIAVTLAIVLVIFFKPVYKRMEAEKNSGCGLRNLKGKEMNCESRQLNDLKRMENDDLVPLSA